MKSKASLDRKKAKEAIESFNALDSIDTLDSSKSKMPLKIFLEAVFDKLQKLVEKGYTKLEIYSFLTNKYNLDLGTYNSFLRAWRKYFKKRISQQGEEQSKIESKSSEKCVVSSIDTRVEERSISDSFCDKEEKNIAFYESQQGSKHNLKSGEVYLDEEGHRGFDF